MRATVGALFLLVAGAALSVLVHAQGAPPRPRITGIHHVAFRVSDMAAARVFYGEMLGLAEAASAKKTSLAYTVGGRQSVILEFGLPPADDERLSHLAFETPDVNALAVHLRSRGLEVQRPADRCTEDAIRVTDPDGHTIEFVGVSWPPAPAATDTRTAQAISDRLLHAGLIVGDEARAHTFYRDTLGFSEIWRGGREDAIVRWVNMRVPDGTDYLEYMLEASAPNRQQRGVLHHLCLRVPDMQAAWEEVARRSVALKRPLPSPPQIGRNGRYQLNLYDPDGTRVELMEPFTVR